MQITGHTFTFHSNLGSLPKFLKAPMQPQIGLIRTTHKEDLRLWEEQEIFKKETKNQLSNDFDENYIADLHDNYTGYTIVTIQK